MGHMPALSNPARVDIAELVERVDDLAESGTTQSYAVINAKLLHGAVGDGVADDTTAIQAAVNDAAGGDVAAYLPPGTYLVTPQMTLQGDIKIVGDNAVIKFDSTLNVNLFKLANGASRVTFEGITFEGSVEENDYIANQGAAIEMPADNVDLTIRNCTFNTCKPLRAGGNAKVHVGRTLIDGCRFLNLPNSVNLVSNSIVRDSFFINDAALLDIPGSHAIYIYGETENVSVQGCHFTNIVGDAIKWNVGDDRYGHKCNGVFTDNLFIGVKSYCIWLGSDQQANVGGFVVANNTFRNCSTAIHSHNASDVVIANNNITYDWEVVVRDGTSGAIEVVSALGLDRMSQTDGIVITGNHVRNKHPFHASFVFTGNPAAGGTVTVGAITYTWADTASATNQISRLGPPTGNEPGGSTEPRFCVANLAAAIRGDQYNTPNPVLRTSSDCFFEATTTTGELVVASDATFTFSENSTNITATAVRDTRTVVGSGIYAREARNLKISSNQLDSVGQISLTNCIEPVISHNDVANTTTAISSIGSKKPRFFYNTFPWLEGRVVSTRGRNNRRILSRDAWPIFAGNGLVRTQEFCNPQMLGFSGTVPVSNGKAKTYLWYGTDVIYNDNAGPYASALMPFHWTDGDTVTLGNASASEAVFTYKRASPGAGQFNTPDSLITLINAALSGGYTASYAPYVNLGSSADPKLMIQIEFDTVGTTQNGSYLRTSTRSELCGQVLRAYDNGLGTPDANEWQYPYFYGGNASANSTKTFCWTPMANSACPPRVQGVDATSQALAPVVYPADIVPGVGFYITHGAAGGAGAESFHWFMEAP